MTKCIHCKATLHLTATPNGTPYWASNSGSMRCFWPYPTRHKQAEENY